MRSLENQQGPGRPSVDNDSAKFRTGTLFVFWLLSGLLGEKSGGNFLQGQPRRKNSDGHFGPVKGHFFRDISLALLPTRPTPI